MITIVDHPEGSKRLGELLAERLQSDVWSSFRAAVAFAKRSGVKHIARDLRAFADRGNVKISIGIDHCGTSAEAIADLFAAINLKGELWVFHNQAPNTTFHPKVYLFGNAEAAECFIGSGNLTEGGLFTNYETFVHLSLDRRDPTDGDVLAHIERLLDEWADGTKGTALEVTDKLIAELIESGDLPTEADINRRTKAITSRGEESRKAVEVKTFFSAVRVPAAPRVVSYEMAAAKKEVPAAVRAEAAKARPGVTGFVITLQKTDVGVGQTTAGTSRRSPELFLPVVCVRANPEFWGWPELFKPDQKYVGITDKDGYPKMDREGVRMRLGSETLSVNWWYNPDKKDYRMRSESLRSAGNIGDILRIELADGKSGFDYYVEIVPKGTSLFGKYLALCTETVRNSPKKWGYY